MLMQMPTSQDQLHRLSGLRGLTPPARRRGFTLIELLVVIAIIGVLASLAIPAVMKFIDSRHRKNSETLLQKMHEQLQTQWSEVVKKAQSEKIPDGVTNWAGGDDRRARVLWIKLRLRQEFPMTYAEALEPWVGLEPYGVVASDFLNQGSTVTYRKKLGNRTQATNRNTEAAACLLMALSQGRQGTKFDADAVLGPSAIKDTDGDGMPEIIDGWGTAVGFYRWGAGSAERDVEDPNHELKDRNWNQAAVTVFQQLCHPVGQTGVAVIVSFGSNKLAGLDRYMNVTNPGQANDNLYSFQTR